MEAAKSKMLLVEGDGDGHMVRHLLECRNLGLPFEISPKGGYPRLRESIPAEVNVSGRDALGIVADANDDLTVRWQSIPDRLNGVGCDVPNAICDSGSIFFGPRGIRVGVWLMPDNRRCGELEDFVHDMIPENDPVLPRAKDYVDGIPEADRKFKNAKLTRTYVHAWLATRKKPRPMGMAISAGDLRHDVPVANSFVCWLRELFEF